MPVPGPASRLVPLCYFWMLIAMMPQTFVPCFRHFPSLNPAVGTGRHWIQSTSLTGHVPRILTWLFRGQQIAKDEAVVYEIYAISMLPIASITLSLRQCNL